MSIQPATDPTCSSCPATPAIATLIDARPRDVGNFQVRRLLPSRARRLVGPFIFLDHLGPIDLAPATGVDVPPHPHIGLATISYLLEGELVHRDSVGAHQAIRPGDVNWMTAGRGIVHSERTGAELRASGSRLHSLQLWVALPLAQEETEPDFQHHPVDTLPLLERDGARLRVLAGTAYGERAPVRTFGAPFYVDATLPAGCALPLPGEHEERAAYVVAGAVDCGKEHAESGRMLVFTPGAEAVLHATSDARVMLLGGAPIDGGRHIWWNFVSSSPERIERAKRDWREQRFPAVPGDDDDPMPLPE